MTETDLIAQWRNEADEADKDGDFCCALTRRNNANDLERLLAEQNAPRCDHKFINTKYCVKCDWTPF